MAEKKNNAGTTSDEELLAHAIPIDEIEDLEEDEELEEVEEVDKKPPPPRKSPPAEEIQSIDLSDADPAGEAKEIRSFDTHTRQQETWKRAPNKSDHGASHVRTFVAKLRLDAIEHLDEQVNEWLDEHPEYDVKLVSTTVGILTGKLKEEALFVNVWV